MKTRLLLVLLFLFSLLTVSPLSTIGQTVITFDDLASGWRTITNSGTIVTFQPIPLLTNGYQGLNWVNFRAMNSLVTMDRYGKDGYYYGMVSDSNIAFNSDGSPAEIDSAGTNFSLLSVYLTGAFNSNLNIEVEGFRSGALVYDKIVVAAATNATLFTFDYMDIDQVTFNSFGGDNAGFPYGGGNIFVADNLTFEFIPEPSSLLLTVVGAVVLWAFLRRGRG